MFGQWLAQTLGREPPGPLEYSRRLWLRLWLAGTFVFLYAPIVILILFSFNDSRRNIVWQGFTLDYYARAWNNASLIEAFANSLAIALVSTIVSTLIGGLLALALWRFRFPGKPALEGAMVQCRVDRADPGHRAADRDRDAPAAPGTHRWDRRVSGPLLMRR